MTSPIRPSRSLAAFVGLALVLAACGADGGPGCPDTAPSPRPEPPYHQDAELEARIPDEANGEPLEVQTVCLTVHDPGGLTTSDAMLERVGVEPRDVTVAIGPSPNTATSSDFVGITAWRYAGAEEAEIRDAFRAMLAEAEIPVEHEEIAGKEVDMALFHAYYVAGDTLYAVLGEEGGAAEVIEALP